MELKEALLRASVAGNQPPPRIRSMELKDNVFYVPVQAPSLDLNPFNGIERT